MTDANAPIESPTSQPAVLHAAPHAGPHSAPHAPRPRVRAALATLNVALLGVVGIITLWPTTVGAQAPVGANRARGDYTMVAGEISAGSNAAIYVIDSANQEVLIMRWDQSRSQFQNLGYRDLAADAVAAPVR